MVSKGIYNKILIYYFLMQPFRIFNGHALVIVIALNCKFVNAKKATRNGQRDFYIALQHNSVTFTF